MPDDWNEAAPTAWRETVRRTAHDAAIVEARTRRSTGDILFYYRWEHVQAVVRLAIRLAELTGADREVVEAAAWLHDVAKGSGSQDHGRDGATAAQRILVETDFPPHKVEAIAKHVGLWTDEPVEPLEAAVVWERGQAQQIGSDDRDTRHRHPAHPGGMDYGVLARALARSGLAARDPAQPQHRARSDRRAGAAGGPSRLLPASRP
jgi:putative nucleotidyltransferase with HDIG domain